MSKRNRRLFWLLLYGSWVTLVVVLLGGCKTLEAPISQEQQAQIKDLAEGRNFTLEADFAYPQTSQAYISAANATVAQAGGNTLTRISLQGEGYFLKLSGDRVESHLPYFGVRDNFSQPGRNEAIELDTEIEDLKISQKKSGAYQMTFFARQNTERFQLTLDLQANGKANLAIYSGQRDAIRFEGRAVANE